MDRKENAENCIKCNGLFLFGCRLAAVIIKGLKCSSSEFSGMGCKRKKRALVFPGFKLLESEQEVAIFELEYFHYVLC